MIGVTVLAELLLSKRYKLQYFPFLQLFVLFDFLLVFTLKLTFGQLNKHMNK
jgi:hypothetical protein